MKTSNVQYIWCMQTNKEHQQEQQEQQEQKDLLGFKFTLYNLTQREVYIITKEWFNKYSELHNRIQEHIHRDVSVQMIKRDETVDTVSFDFEVIHRSAKNGWLAEPYVYMLLGMLGSIVVES